MNSVSVHRREEDRGSGSLQNCTTRRPRRSDSPPQLETIASGVPQRDTAKALRGRNGTSDEGLPTSLPLPDAGRNTNREDRTADDARGEGQWTRTASVRHCAQMNTRRHIITTTANDLWRPRRSGLRESGGAGRRVSNRPPVSGGRAKKRKVLQTEGRAAPPLICAVGCVDCDVGACSTAIFGFLEFVV